MCDRAVANVCLAFPTLVLFHMDRDYIRRNRACRTTTARFPSPFIQSTNKVRQSRTEVRIRGSRNQVSNYQREAIITLFHIKNLEDTALNKYAFIIQQLKFDWEGPVKEWRQMCLELGIPDVTIGKATKQEFKVMVKKA